MKKKIPIFVSVLTLIYILLPSPIYGHANVIEHWDSGTLQKVQENFGSDAWVIVVGNPNNNGFADVINNYSFNWVIRGHAHWKDIGQKMLSDPEGAAVDWNNFFSKLNKKVYFQPWNEPTSINPECNGMSLEDCVPKIARFINALDTSKIKLTTPALDPHNQENTVGELINLLKTPPHPVNLNKFQAATINVYSPDLAKQLPSLLSQWGLPSLPIIVTESGIIKGGSVVYQAQPLCEDMFCNGVVNFWESNSQIIGWSMFSNYQGWNLWRHECVIDALNGNCHCEDCDDSTAVIPNEMYNRSGGPEPNVNDPDFRISRGWPAGPSTMEAKSEFHKFLAKLMKIVGDPVKALFKHVTTRGPVAWIADLFDLGSQDLVPTDRNGRYPAENPYDEKVIVKNKLELPGTTANICIPGRSLDYTFKYFPDQHPDKFMVELLNLTSVHEQVANSLSIFNEKMRPWAVGEGYSDYLEPVGMLTDEGKKEMQKRMSALKAGYISKRYSGAKIGEIYNFGLDGNGGLKKLLASGDENEETAPQNNPEDIESGIPLHDKPLIRVCEDGPRTEVSFTKETADHRPDRQGCIEYKPSVLACCNPQHVEEVLGLDYNKVCEDVVGWACDGDSIRHDLEWLYEPYYTGKFVSDSRVSEADWPIYLEQCYEAKEKECEAQTSYSGFFIDLTDNQRGNVFPPATWEEPHPQNQFLTEVKGKCFSCQVTIFYLPQGLGALDACREMTATYLPGSMYEEIINKNHSQRKDFPCNAGKLPKTDGKITNKDSRVGKNFQKLTGEESWHGFVSEVEVDNNCDIEYTEETVGAGTTDPATGGEINTTVSVPKRCTSKVKLETYTHIYVPHYEKLQLCTNFYFGLLPGRMAEELKEKLEEENGNVLKAEDLLEEAKIGNAGSIYSGLDPTGDRVKDYQNDPTNVWGRSDVNYTPMRFPGGGTEAGLKASQKLYFPGEWHSQLGI